MAYADKSLKRKKKTKQIDSDPNVEVNTLPLTESLNRLRVRSDSVGSSGHLSLLSERSNSSTTLTRRGKKKRTDEIEMGIKNVEVLDQNTAIHTVEVLKRPGQTLGFYIREGDGRSTKRGVFISRIAEGSIVQRNGLLKVGDEIQAINTVNVTRTNLDDVVVLMSIPKKLVLTIKTRKLSKDSKPQYAECKPVYVHKRYSSDGEASPYHLDLNTEDSNDSGLSSEHSVKGDKPEIPHYPDLPPPASFNSATLPARKHQQQLGDSNHVYTKTRPARTELSTSDTEHEYTPSPHLGTFKADKKQSRKVSNKSRHNSGEAYNSDSELLPKIQPHDQAARPNPWILVNGQRSRPSLDPSMYSTPNHGFSTEMQHWLRKFDHMSQELHSLPDRANHKGVFF